MLTDEQVDALWLPILGCEGLTAADFHPSKVKDYRRLVRHVREETMREAAFAIERAAGGGT